MKAPNIVFIMADDLGHWSLGCEVNRDAITPHIDRLAAEGLQMRRFYCASPVCSPARASLLTGQMPSYHGIVDWIRRGNVTDGDDSAIDYLQGLEGYTLALKRAGYLCGISGKWHLGDSALPQQGFDHWYVHQRGGGSYFDAPMVRDGKLIKQPGYLTHAITEDACGFIRDHAAGDRPFYLQVGYTAPHTPWVNSHPAQYLDLYRDCAFDSCPVASPHPDQLPYPMFQDDRHKMLQGYFASLTAMDEGVGQLLRALEDAGILDDSLVVFTSDNGFSCGHHGVWGKGNGTYPFNLYESAVKVPFILRYPRLIEKGVVSDALTGAYDWAPTVLELAGVPALDKSGPGHSFVDVLAGRDTGADSAAFVYDEYGASRMLVTKDLKYIKRYPDGPNLLFDLAKDPLEAHDLYPTAPPALIAALDNRLESWFSAHTRPHADSRSAGVMGFGQDKRPDGSGYPPDAFCQTM